MKPSFRIAAAALLAAALVQAPAYALFDDNEARRAILDIRGQLDALKARVDGKAEKTTNLDLAGQNEQLRQEVAQLRGQVEVLTNELNTLQKRQKDFYTDLDGRLRKLEPQRIQVDGQEVSVQVTEQKAYDNALTLFRGGNYKGANTAFSDFLKTYPDSGLTASALYWLGNSYYAQRDYRNAISVQQKVVSNHAGNPKAADALLNMASSYIELGDKAKARKALQDVVALYPEAPAAQTAQERLATLR